MWPAIALLYCVSSSTLSGFGVAMGLKSHEKRSEYSAAEISQWLLALVELLLLVLLELLLVELSLVEMKDLLVVGVLVLEGFAEFGVEAIDFPGPP